MRSATAREWGSGPVDDHGSDGSAGLGLRLGLVGLAALIVAVPFSLLLVAVVDGWGPLHRLDLSVARDLNVYANSHRGVVSLLTALSTVFHPTMFRVVGVVVAVLLLVRRRPRLALWLVVTIEGGGIISSTVKGLVDRRRPVLPHPVAHAAGQSFPSGHALGVIVGVGALLLVGLPLIPRRARPGVALLGLVVVLAVGYSRLGLGVHYVSDVLGGYLLGLAWLAATTAAFRAWQRDAPRRPDRTDVRRSAAPRNDAPVIEGLEPDLKEDP